MKFSVIYEQVTKTQAQYIIECDNEEALNAALEKAEIAMRKTFGDRFDDLHDRLMEQPEIEVVEYNEEYSEDWEAPEYYDHYLYKERE